jgi:two-component system, NtrC family, sensor kinase
MKKILLLFIFFFINQGSSYAQAVAKPYTPQIDSIQQLLSTQPADDTTKVKRLNDLALLCLFDMQFERGMLAAKQARQLSQKLNYLKGEGLYLNYMMFMTGGISPYYYLKKALFYADNGVKDEPNKLMEIFPQKRDPEKVIVKLLEAFKYFEKDNDKEMMAHMLWAIGANYQMLNKTNENIQYTDQAKKLFMETGQPELALMVSLNKVLASQANNKIKEENEIENDAKEILANIKDVRERAFINYVLGSYYMNVLRGTALGFEHLLNADYELEKIGEKDLRIFVLSLLGYSFDDVAMYQKSVDYFKKAIEFKIEAKQFEDIAFIYIETLFELVPLKKFDEAKQYLEKARSFANEIKDKHGRTLFEARIHDASGQLLMGQGKYQEALTEYFQANKIAKDLTNEPLSMYFNSYIAQCYQKLGDLDKSILFAERSYKQILITQSEQWLKIKTSLLLSEVYEETGQFKQAFEYLKKYRSFIKEKEEQDIANLATNLAIENFTQKNEQEKASYEQEKVIKENEIKNQRWWLFSIAAALLSSFVFLYFLYRTNQHKQKANTVLENTLSKLKSTQSQLIQSEKMASLGELTAGIAHEIQNPLNFVNNFASINTELIDEMNIEIAKGNHDEVKALAIDIKNNEQKIMHHGKRAESIVKGMLQHSRKSTGAREPTDINALADEYLRLSYHGIKAKDPKDAGHKNFNATMETDFDENIDNINIIPQDIGRVLLNLYNNAFYAVNEKQKQGIEGYEPIVSVSTKKEGNNVLISVKDNGNGIPQKIMDKIFQPFFTTKPTGQGTGLGLSLAYDIIKAHGGDIKAETKVGLGTEFNISLPVNQ